MKESKFDWLEKTSFACFGAGLEYYDPSENISDLALKIAEMGVGFLIGKVIMKSTKKKN